jgi:hypothetical protein
VIFALRRANNCWSFTCAGRGNFTFKVSEIRPLGEDCDLADPSLTTSGVALGLTLAFPTRRKPLMFAVQTLCDMGFERQFGSQEVCG